MADYLNSSAVNVFPSSYRMVKGDGKFTSEHNFANIILSIVDKDSYVINFVNDTLTIVINGYLFEIESFTPDADDWFGIGIQDGGGNALVNYSSGATTLDDISGTGKFYGLFHANSATQPTPPETVSGVNYYYLHATDSTGAIINKFKLNASSVQIADTADGDLSVDDELNYKNYRLTVNESTAGVYTGLSGYVDGDTPELNDSRLNKNVIKINSEELNKLNGLESAGSRVTPVYFNEDGVAKQDIGPVGQLYQQSGNAYKSTSVYIKRDSTSNVGEITEGFTMYASTYGTDDTIGKDGDFWLKYNG